jgi:hypothetical protein
MTLQSGSSETESFVKGEKVGDGVYVKKTKILNAVDFLDAELRFDKKPDLIGVVCYMDQGKDWGKELIISGFPRRDPVTKQITAWGGAKCVDKLLTQVAGWKGQLVSDIGRINSDAIKALIGHELWWLEFVAALNAKGYLIYNAFPSFATISEGKDPLVAEFRTSLAEQSWVTKRYSPGLIQAGVRSTGVALSAEDLTFPLPQEGAAETGDL